MYRKTGKYKSGIKHYCKGCHKKIGVTKTNRCRSCAAKYGWKNRINKSLNLKHGFYSIHNPNIHKCCDCGEPIWSNPKTKRCKSCENKRRFKLRIMDNKGDKNGGFVHGKGGRKYPKEFDKKLKRKIFERDNYTCQKCYIYPCNDLTVHHIDYNKQNNKENNLITLCRKCNLKVNANRDYWYAYFTYIIELL